jgi:DNA primase
LGLVRAEGPLEKPDVIGALFGQPKVCLVQTWRCASFRKKGKIGRIEVDLEIVDGKSVGQIQVSSALDKNETTLVAAALETIDRIGPTEAQIEISKIEDVRGSKREFIMDRAKKLLEGLDGDGSFREMTQNLKEDTRAAKIMEYGATKIPVGDISGPELIVVEGRADVVNLLRNRVNNVVGMNGTKLPPEIAELGRTKELTLFVDGDRGGKLIANNVISNAKVAYVAVAPDGKEVEELTGKEILMALRKKIPTGVYLRRENFNGGAYGSDSQDEEAEPMDEAKRDKLRDVYEDQGRGTKSALLLDSDFSVIRKVGAREVPRSLKMSKKKFMLLFLTARRPDQLFVRAMRAELLTLAQQTFGY